MTLRKPNWIAAACLAALSCSTSANAQDDGAAGIVRISDGKARTTLQPVSFHGHGGYTYTDAGNGDCQNGNCQNGYCQHGGQCFHGFFQERYCKNSPDHGYSPPAKYPLHRRGVQYDTYFPNQWYGTPGATYAPAPIVYQPTDTTQLGYTYQHVPFWQPATMPQRPIPAQWHITAPVVNASRFHGGFGGCQCQNCQLQMQYQNSAPVTNPTPIEQPTPVPATDAKPEASVPPAPRQFENSAASGHIRRAGF